MERENSGTHGIKWGVIIGIIYCLLLFFRFSAGGNNAGMFGLLTFVGFITVIVLLFICGINYRKRNGGFVEMKDAFKAMFIAVLIFELLYAVFTLIYLKYIDPGFFGKFRNSTESLLIAAKQSPADSDKILEHFGQQVLIQSLPGITAYQ